MKRRFEARRLRLSDRAQFPVGLLPLQPLLRRFFRQEWLRFREHALLPRVIGAPLVRIDDGRSRRRRRLEQLETEREHLALHENVERAARRISEREIAEDEARDAAPLDDVARTAEHDGRNTVRFQMPSRQTGGLVTDGSDGRQHGDVHAVLAHLAQDQRRIDGHRLALAVLGVNHLEARRHGSDASGRDAFLKPRQR